MTIALAALAVFVGAALQSATGFGFALVAAPVLFALLGPREAVTAGVLLGLVLNALTLGTERRRPTILARDAATVVGWSVPGLALGALALRELPEVTDDFAKSVGAGWETADQMREAIAADGPVVLDVHVTPEENCYPMIPAGQAARDMVG